MDAAATEVFRFAYDPNNRLTNRWTAATGTTTYKYDLVGNLTNIDYAVSPDITLQYDSLNRLTNMADAVGTTVYSYTSAGQLLSEDGPWASDTVSYTYNNRLRATLSLLQPGSAAWTNGYLYDVAKRLTNVTSQAGGFGYVYSSSPSPLVSRLVLPNTAFITNSYDSVARLLSTQLKNSGGTVLNSHSYSYNVGNQRTKQTRTDGSFVDYGYDGISQLKTALGKESGGTTNRLQEQMGYTYDAAGNMNYRTNNAFLQTFNVNSLNELTTLTRSGTLTVAGNTTAAATNVTVNSLTATRYADKTWAKDSFPLVDGTTNFTAIAKTGFGLADTNTVTVDLRATNTFVYDLNGNLRTNGTEVLEYDDENRLVTNYVSAAWKSEFTYDGRNRRRIQRDYGWSGSAWTKTNETRLVYDGNLILQHRDSGNTPTLTLTRGPDLAGSFEGAGGIGGLLAMTESFGTHSFYHADGNGNVTCLINTNQLIVARYIYDPFGSTLSISGPKAFINTYRFSSKPIHVASGKYDYLYRWYAPELQRFLNADPIGEAGGINIFAFVRNSPLNVADAFGMEPTGPAIPKHIEYPQQHRKCCTDEVIRQGENTLKGNFAAATAEAAKLGLRPVPIGQNGASCKNSSADILDWLTPFPRCWTCYLELREKRVLGIKVADHQVIICRGVGDSGTQKEIMFDWWGDQRNSSSNSGGSPSPFRSEYSSNPVFVHHPSGGNSFLDCSNNPIFPFRPYSPSCGFPACTAK